MTLKRRHRNLEEQKQVIRNDIYLKKLLKDEFSQIQELINKNFSDRPTINLEIGSSGGVSVDYLPTLITSDIVFDQDLNIVFDATKIPFRDNCIDFIIMFDVLHHIKNLEEFFSQLKRITKPGSILYFKEPYWSPIGEFIWKYIHPEEYDTARIESLDKDPMSGNQAIAKILLTNKIKNFQYFLGNIEVEIININRGISFLLSGGNTFTTKINRRLLIFIYNLEKRSKILKKISSLSISFYVRIL